MKIGMHRSNDVSDHKAARNPKEKSEPIEEPGSIDGFQNFGYVTLQGVHNTRDLGGMPAADGKRIVKRRLMRSGDLHGATIEDIEVLCDGHHLCRVVDFRTDAERKEQPDPEKDMQEVGFSYLPAFQTAALGITHEGGAAGDMAALKEFTGNPYQMICGMYPKALLEDAGIKAYSSFFRVLLEAPEGATLWHCTEGKDRAGIASILIEHALGVSEDNVRADYLATNLFVRDWAERMLDMLAKHHIAEKIDADIDALFYAHSSYYDTALDAVSKEYGSLDGYLDKALGVDADAIAELRARYLE